MRILRYQLTLHRQRQNQLPQPLNPIGRGKSRIKMLFQKTHIFATHNDFRLIESGSTSDRFVPSVIWLQTAIDAK